MKNYLKDHCIVIDYLGNSVIYRVASPIRENGNNYSLKYLDLTQVSCKNYNSLQCSLYKSLNQQ